MMNYDEYFTKAVLPHVEHDEDLKQCAYVWGKAAWDRALLHDISGGGLMDEYGDMDQVALDFCLRGK